MSWQCVLTMSRQQQLEQERRDRELALRLAAEDQSMVEDIQSVRLHIASVYLLWLLALRWNPSAITIPHTAENRWKRHLFHPESVCIDRRGDTQWLIYSGWHQYLQFPNSVSTLLAGCGIGKDIRPRSVKPAAIRYLAQRFCFGAIVAWSKVL